MNEPKFGLGMKRRKTTWGEAEMRGRERQNKDQVYDKTYMLIGSFPLQETEIHDSVTQ